MSRVPHRTEKLLMQMSIRPTAPARPVPLGLPQGRLPGPSPAAGALGKGRIRLHLCKRGDGRPASEGCGGSSWLRALRGGHALRPLGQVCRSGLPPGQALHLSAWAPPSRPLQRPGVWSPAAPTSSPRRPSGWPKAGEGPFWPPEHSDASTSHQHTGCHPDQPPAALTTSCPWFPLPGVLASTSGQVLGAPSHCNQPSPLPAASYILPLSLRSQRPCQSLLWQCTRPPAPPPASYSPPLSSRPPPPLGSRRHPPLTQSLALTGPSRRCPVPDLQGLKPT